MITSLSKKPILQTQHILLIADGVRGLSASRPASRRVVMAGSEFGDIK